jgi:hypothetical protein
VPEDDSAPGPRLGPVAALWQRHNELEAEYDLLRNEQKAAATRYERLVDSLWAARTQRILTVSDNGLAH